MNILIVSATYLEIEPLLLQLKFEKKINQKLTLYSYQDYKINVLITGVGMTSTAYWLGKTLNKESYDLALNLGLAGSFEANTIIGEVVHVISDRISELGAEDGKDFLSLTDMGLVTEEDSTLDHKEMKKSSIIENNHLKNLKEVTAITVNTAHGDEDSIQKIKTLFNPQVESMEGAAFFYACLQENIDCLQIRAISNKVERRNKDKWNIPLAVKNLCSTALQIINSLK